MKKKVIIGFLGTKLDAGFSRKRWDKWRPSVSLVQQENQHIDRVELLYSHRFEELANQVKSDMLWASPDTEVNLVKMELENPWDFEEVYAALYDWLKTYPFDTEHEEYLAHITTGTHVAQICLFLLVEARFLPGLLLQSSPIVGAENKSTGSFELIDLDLSRYNKLAQRFHEDHQNALNFLKNGIATRNAQFNSMIEEIERIAVRSKAPVLLVGPTGAGKSFLARKIYALKKNKHQTQGDFVEVNCATLKGESAMSALFGHKKGAFTGAATERAGLLRVAHKGVLFLDEIAELGLDEQAMLLKAIEEKRFLPVGADHEVQSDFQLIAGTNRDLRTEVSTGQFREDLFARINLWTYALPSLSERREDIEPNLDYLLTLYMHENGDAVRFNVEAKKKYLQFAQSPHALWRGNFRDLSASIMRMATLADKGRITTEQVEAEIERLSWMWDASAQPSHSASSDPTVNIVELIGNNAWAEIDLFDQMQLQAVLQVCQDCRTLSEAGKRLFNISREQRSIVNDADRLRKYLQKFGLSWELIKG